jgi:hypothetical protein
MVSSYGSRPSKSLKGKVLERNRHMKTITKFTCPAFAALALASFAVLSTGQAVTPPPDGGYPGYNTAEGEQALLSLTTGQWNTALGFQALSHQTAGNSNTATGGRALFSNTTGFQNTANGAFALFANTVGVQNSAFGWKALASNTTGGQNTANGYQALFSNIAGAQNAATGYSALFANTIGAGNTADGYQALLSNTTGGSNTASGSVALDSNTTGSGNTAVGTGTLGSNTDGFSNTAIGIGALSGNTHGFRNIAVGVLAGYLTTGRDNIDIGNAGAPGEDLTIRIGSGHTRTFVAGINGVNEGGTISAVYINADGQLGTQPPPSSRHFKKDIKPMSDSSEAILALKPVTFHYKSDNSDTPQFGLIAEDVAEVNPDLVVRDANGEIYTVRYEAVNAMLLNEFLKEHRKVEKQETTISQLRSTVAQQQKDFEATVAQLTKRLDEQASQIQKVSAQLAAASPSHGGLEANGQAPQMVSSNQ